MATTIPPSTSTKSHEPFVPSTTWLTHFDESTRGRLLNDDATAWRNVTGILITIIGAATILALITVLLLWQ